MSAHEMTVINYEVSHSATTRIPTDKESDTPSETVILELTGSGRVFTALEPTSLSRSASYTCVATNYEILWVDELASGPPILTWRHDMGSGAIRRMNLQILNGPNSGENFSWAMTFLIDRVHFTFLARHIPCLGLRRPIISASSYSRSSPLYRSTSLHLAVSYYQPPKSRPRRERSSSRCRYPHGSH